ncbi:MAG: Ca2+-dependent phosphoinositide-specific phospholipase C [Pseudomonadota bacterium]|nr:Ca2+-dependent phosphoinositide-specific phospholipase C [Pseudomonadota bacterium]
MQIPTILLFTLSFVHTVSAASLNDYQWIGSHNSYKKALPESVYQYLVGLDKHAATQLNYGHISLEAQLDSGLRQLEIDVVNDVHGNRYSHPELAVRFGENWLNDQEIEQLSKPGFKVLHIPHVDMKSHCFDLTRCLSKLVRWSDDHPKHFPIVVMMNAKESQPSFIKRPAPCPFTAQTFNDLDKVIREQMKDKLITPDAIRGSRGTLREAIVNAGWPDVSVLRGKFLFLFDGNKSQTKRFMQGHAGLAGRAMFTSLPADDPGAAIMIVNDPVINQREILQLVSDGFLVRTRADADFSASRQEKSKQRKAAFSSGAQIISTDFYPGSPQALRDKYEVSFAKGAVLRTNPFFTKSQTQHLTQEKR